MISSSLDSIWLAFFIIAWAGILSVPIIFLFADKILFDSLKHNMQLQKQEKEIVKKQSKYKQVGVKMIEVDAREPLLIEPGQEENQTSGDNGIQQSALISPEREEQDPFLNELALAVASRNLRRQIQDKECDAGIDYSINTEVRHLELPTHGYEAVSQFSTDEVLITIPTKSRKSKLYAQSSILESQVE